MNLLTNHIMMIRPANFGFNDQTASNNAFQSTDKIADAKALGHAMQLDTEKRIIIAIEIFLTKVKECPVRFFSIDYMTINLVNLFQKS